MKIAFYCQHVLGIGHVHRSMELCKTLAAHHEVTMITGGAPLLDLAKSFSHYQLPGLMMDANFENLAPCTDSSTLDEIKALRKELLFNFFLENRPDVFIIELYPFGRKAFRFELDPILEGICDKLLSPCLVYCSLRDILVERTDKDKFEQRIITTLNRYFDGVLIHGDQHFIPLEQTFSRVGDISVPIEYTGYVTPDSFSTDRLETKKRLGLSNEMQLIVASIGGGNVGSELLFKLIDAFLSINNNTYYLKIFTGPYVTFEDFTRLKAFASESISVERFTPHFQDWLVAADLSVSMAGYNTIMNILSAGVPALLYPFIHNQEQSMRIDLLKNQIPIKKLDKEDLRANILAEHIKQYLKKKRFSSPISLKGSTNTLHILEMLSEKNR